MKTGTVFQSKHHEKLISAALFSSAARRCATPGCDFEVTWHSTYCCAACGSSSGAHHGIKCERRMWFESAGHESPTSMDFERFQSKMRSPEMTDYFKAINLDPSCTRTLFKLMDLDGDNIVQKEDLVNGMTRLCGDAKALALARVSYRLNYFGRILMNYIG